MVEHCSPYQDLQSDEPTLGTATSKLSGKGPDMQVLRRGTPEYERMKKAWRDLHPLVAVDFSQIEAHVLSMGYDAVVLKDSD